MQTIRFWEFIVLSAVMICVQAGLLLCLLDIIMHKQNQWMMLSTFGHRSVTRALLIWIDIIIYTPILYTLYVFYLILPTSFTIQTILPDRVVEGVVDMAGEQ